MEPKPRNSATSKHELAASYLAECWSQADEKNPERIEEQEST